MKKDRKSITVPTIFNWNLYNIHRTKRNINVKIRQIFALYKISRSEKNVIVINLHNESYTDFVAVAAAVRHCERRKIHGMNFTDYFMGVFADSVVKVTCKVKYIIIIIKYVLHPVRLLSD